MTAQDPIALLNEKFDTLIRIQAGLAVKDMITQREKIVFLYSVGLGPTFIATTWDYPKNGKRRYGKA